MPSGALVALVGPQRGTTWWLPAGRSRLVERQGHLELVAEEAGDLAGRLLALVDAGSEGITIHAAASPLRVSGERCSDRRLRPGDLVELGDAGWLLRYRRAASAGRPYKRLPDALGDCLDCARHADSGPLRRLGVFLRGAFHELTTQVAPRVRLALAATLALLVVAVLALYQRNVALEAELDQQLARLEGLEELLRQGERRSISPDDLTAVSRRLGDRLDDALARLDTLERRADARTAVITQAADRVIFLQGSYGFLEPRSGRTVHRTGPDDDPVLTLEEEGTELEVLYTGSGFVVGDEGLVLTNRHVAVPWEFDRLAQTLGARGLVAVRRRFIGYLPDAPSAFDVKVERVHPSADLALLRCDTSVGRLHGLQLADAPPRLGTEVVVLGYPTGIAALLARSDPRILQQLNARGTLGFWQVTEALARAGAIEPLATVGVVGQVTDTSVVYDAETTHGGSGGPVLSLDGRVVAVNAAIVPEFGGSNLGVPAARARELLEAAGAAAADSR